MRSRDSASRALAAPDEERANAEDRVEDREWKDDARRHVGSTVTNEVTFRKLTRISSPQLVDANHELPYDLVNGVSVEDLRADGTVGYDPVRVLDFETLEANGWLVVNQFTVTEFGHTRRPDVVVFVTGLPLALLELENAASSMRCWSFPKGSCR